MWQIIDLKIIDLKIIDLKIDYIINNSLDQDGDITLI